MTWRDNVLEAGSFRGAPFLYESSEGEIGRRTALKEFPGRDKPYSEDLGLRTRRFTLEMFVVGPDYDVDRDALRRAFEKPGPGELDHPYLGTMQVTVDGPVKMQESTKKGGMCRFTATFVEAGANLSSVLQSPDSALAVLTAASKLADDVQAAFARAFNTVNAITAVVDSAVAAVQSVASTLNSVRGKIAAALQVIDDMKAAIEAVVDGVTDLIKLPMTLANELMGLVSTVVASINSITDAFSELADFFGSDGEEAVAAAGSIFSSSTRVEVLTIVGAELAAVGSTLSTPTEGDTATASQNAIAENQRQLIRLVKAATVVEVARLATELTFENAEQTTRVQALVTTLVDTLLSDATLPDELYAPLCNLRAAVVRHLTQLAETLAPVSNYVPLATLPSLAIAYQVYGDADREAELLARNPQVRDPTAVPGGQALKVVIE